MTPPTLAPDKNTLQRWLEEGLTQQQMVQRHFDETGILVSRTTIAGAMVRNGLSAEGNRWKDALPWRVRDLHGLLYPARMLRYYARRTHGLQLHPADDRRLNSWLKMLEDEDAIVGYDPDSSQGFHYIDKQFKDHDDPTPIRKKRIYT